MDLRFFYVKMKVDRSVLCVFVFACLCSSANGSLADLMAETTQLCCNQGSAFARNHSLEECSTSLPPDVPASASSLCIFVMDQCCKDYYLKKKDCDTGMVLGKTSKNCEEISSTETMRSCCEKCQEGLEAGRVRGEGWCKQQISGEHAEELLAVDAFNQCCIKVARILPTAPPQSRSSHLSSESITVSKTLEPAASICEDYAPNELCAHHCIPIPGSYKCECNPGYMLMSDKKNCKEVTRNRCKPRNSCQHKCNDNGIEVKCSCKRGYQLMSDGKSCEDIDECVLTPPVCLDGTECHNVQGSYKCIPMKKGKRKESGSCPPGYTRNLVNNVCDDINECLLPNPPCTAYLCQNTIGGYSCGGVRGDPANLPTRPTLHQQQQQPHSTTVDERCPPGFKAGINEQCEDVDECQVGNDDCNRQSQICINTRGSYHCQDQGSKHCPPGFKIDTNTGRCEDINECEDGQDICKINQICVNELGEYDCRPVDEAIKRMRICPDGMRLIPGTGTCQDINECAEGTHLCDQYQKCLNTNGSHECHCRIGFEIDPTTGACVDINECATMQHNCLTTSQRCDNTVGSYLCVRFVSCGTGYVLHHSKSKCEDIDECAVGSDNCARAGPGFRCENLPGSFRCVRVTTSTSTTSTLSPEYEYEYYDSDDEEEVNKRNETSTTTTTTTTTTARSPPPEDTSEEPSSTSETSSPSQNLDEEEEEEEEELTETPEYPGQSTSSLPKEGRARPEEPIRRKELPKPKDTTRPEYSLRAEYSPRPEYSPQPEPSPRSKYSPQQEHSPRPEYPRSELPIVPYSKKTLRPSKPQKPPSRRPSEPPQEQYPDQPDQSPENKLDEETPLQMPDEQTNPSNNVISSTYYFEPRESSSVTPTDKEEDEEDNTIDTDSRSESTYSSTTQVKAVGNVHISPGTETAVVTEEKESDGSEVVDTENISKNKWIKIKENPCQKGFELDEYGACLDIDECATAQHTCSGLTEACRNTMGGYLCDCAPSFRRDPYSGACVLIGISSTSTSTSTTTVTPTTSSTMAPTVKVYTTPTTNKTKTFWGYPEYSIPNVRPFKPRSMCDIGYNYNTRTSKCDDIDECKNGQANCAAEEICVNSEGGYKCECQPNWKVDEIRHRCMPPRSQLGLPPGYENRPVYHPTEKDEEDHEQENMIVTPQIAQIGNGASVSKCPWGYKLTDDGNCEDIDECLSGEAQCGSQQLCSNLAGGYTCRCLPGHELTSDHQCRDVDECAAAGDVPLCSQNADCINTVGSYQCRCHPGFRPAPVNNKVCVDVDECSVSGSKLCQHKCSNLWGRYKCTCHRGYRLNSDNRTCSDIDECSEFKNKIICVGRCMNEPGSYRCTCPSGYRLSEDRKSCIDINECETGEAPCSSTSTYNGTSDVCLNTRGGYRCFRITCPPGYRLESRHRCTKVDRVCRPADYDCAHQATTYSYNYITFVSKLYIPASKVDLFTMRGPAWPHARMKFQLRLLHATAPPHVRKKADISSFLLVQTANQAVMSLVESLEGPQSIELELSMDLYSGEQFGGTAVAKLFIYISEYEF